MSIKLRTRRLERTLDTWYQQFLETLSEDDYLAEFLRSLTLAQGSFTRKEVEGYIVKTGGALEDWSDSLDRVLERCEVVSRDSTPRRYRADWTLKCPEERTYQRG